MDIFHHREKRESKSDGCRKGLGQREKRFHISSDEDGELHLISPSALHMCCECSERERESEASSTKWKFLCFSHSCSMTLQMAALPFVQPPGISPNHNGITSEKTAGKSDFIICHCGNICAGRKRGHKALGFPAMSACILLLKTHTHIYTTVFKCHLTRVMIPVLRDGLAQRWNVNIVTLNIFLFLLF